MLNTRHIVPEQFQRYVGYRPPVTDPYARAEIMAFTLRTECLAAPHTPFGRLTRNGLHLCEETEDYLYDTDFGCLSEAYRPGTRPWLERWVDQFAGSAPDQRQTAIALNQSLRNEVPARFGRPPAFLYGEDDEQTLLKGGGHCSCKSRLLIALCQVAGLPARPVMMWRWRDRADLPDRALGGHTVVEVRIDGQWAFFDPARHLYVETADGHIPSVRELRADRSLMVDMPAANLRRIAPADYEDRPSGTSGMAFYWWKNFHPNCPTSVGRHDVNDPGIADWNWATDQFRAAQRCDEQRDHARLIALADRGELTDEIYAMALDDWRGAMNITDGRLHSLVGCRPDAAVPGATQEIASA
jgi:hypothetical protein